MHAKDVRRREQERTGQDEFLPFAAHPGSSGFGGQDGAIQMPLSARQFQVLGDDLFATALIHAAANQ